MTNKKGGTIFKLILIILLTTIFSIFVIYVMKAIKDKNKITTTKDNIKMVENIEFNPLEHIYDYYIYGYKTSNGAQYSPTSTNSFNYETNSNVYVYAQNTTGFWNNTLINQYPNTYTNFSYAIPTLALENTINIGEMMKNCHQIMYQQSGSLGTSSVSSAIGINCEIPIEYFNFTLYNNFSSLNAATIFFNIQTDAGNYSFRSGYLTFSASTSFVGTSIYNVIPAATKVLRFGFWVVQTSSSSSNVGGYLPQYNNYAYRDNNYIAYYNGLNETQKKSLCYITFSNSTYGSEYTNGYYTGYNEGISYSSQTINNLNSRILDLTSQINELTSLTESQQITINNLQTQINENETNFKGLFFTIADIPFKTVANALGFEALGMNLFNFFVGVITALGMIWLIRKIWL